jgi:hypothetical protein
MSRASSQPATLRADIIPAGLKDWLSIAEAIAARLRDLGKALYLGPTAICG